jgi:competence protein ComEC
MRVGLKVGAILVLSGFTGALIAFVGPSEPTRLTFLSVGQGDCAVFQSSGHTILIDVGPNMRGNDAGKKIVVPELRRLGVDAIDMILISHPDMDHMGGLGSVLKSVRVGHIAISARFAKYPPLLQHLREAGCGLERVMWLGSEQKASVGEFDVEVECPPWFAGDPANDGSEFVKLRSPKASVVFTGDASSWTEERMSPLEDWSAQIMKLGHHGSRTATGEEWLDEVHPQWAVLSCGRNNSYGHPHKEVLDRVAKHGIKLARTDREGDITFELGDTGWERR